MKGRSRVPAITGLLVAFLVAGGVRPLAAQTLVNPTKVEFNPSGDHDVLLDGTPMVERYEMEIFVQGATQPTRTVNLGKPSPGGDGKILINFVNLLSEPLPTGTIYIATVSAVGPGGRATSNIAPETFSFAVACTYSVSPLNPASLLAAGGTASVTVTAPAGCAWTASESVGWLSITSGASGSGNGTVTYTATANTVTSPRSTTMTVAGQAVTVSQDAAPCTFVVSPLNPASLAAAGGTASVTVTAPAGCAWTASESAPWLSITSGASGTGNGTVTYAATANTVTSPRSTTMTVAGQAVTVAQDAAPCTFTVSPLTPASLAAGGGSASVTVTAQTGCAWTASESASWLTVTAGASGTGNGTVTYAATANTVTSSRSATLTVAGQAVTVTQDAAPCTFTVSPLNPTSLAATGGSASVTVTAPTGCAWTATEPADWLTITAGASGTGNGTVSYTAAANLLTSSRNTTMTVAGQAVTITQDAAACNFTVSPLNPTSIAAAGGSASVTVTAQTGCAWTASESTDWLTITAGASGTGNGTVTYSVSPNTVTSFRSAPMTVAGQTVTVTQDAAPCTFDVSPLNPASLAAEGGTASVTVTAPAGCGWTASESVPWLSITTGSKGAGNGTVTYTATANSSTTSRSTTLTVAGQSVAITQDGIACSFAVSPLNPASLAASGGTGSVTVTTSSGCAWTASESVAWLSITSGASGTGNGSVNYTAAANTTTTSRSATLMVGGQPVTITQDAAPCSFTVTPLNPTVSAVGGGISITVTTSTGCAWTASESASWLSITSGSSGTGSGTVSVSASANTTASGRTATVTVAGQTVTVTQPAAVPKPPTNLRIVPGS